MKILSNTKWENIDTQIKDLKEQISDLAEEIISKENKIKELQGDYDRIFEMNRELGQQVLDLQTLKMEIKKLKALCTKNGIDYKKEKKK